MNKRRVRAHRREAQGAALIRNADWAQMQILMSRACEALADSLAIAFQMMSDAWRGIVEQERAKAVAALEWPAVIYEPDEWPDELDA